MSIQSEITRINNNVQTTLNTIAETGVSVGTNSDALPAAAAALANEKLDKSGGTMTGPLNFSGGDGATSGKIILDNAVAGQITNNGNSTLFGFASSGTGTLTVGHGTYNLAIRGKASRPTYNSSDLALKSDIPAAVTVDSDLSSTSTNPVQNKVINSALAGKANSSHTHTPSQISLSGGTAGALDPLIRPLVGSGASNKTFGLPQSAIVVEYSNDGGSTWTSYTTDARDLFDESRPSPGYYLGKASTKGTQTTNSMLRVTIEPTDRYCQFDAVYHWMSNEGNTVVFDLERSTIGAKDTFTKILSNQSLSGWSGNNIHYFSAGQFGGGSTQTSNFYKYRLTYKMTAVTASYGAARIFDIRFFGQNVWSAPGATVGHMLLYNAPYKVDPANSKVVFPGTVQASTFTGALNGCSLTSGIDCSGSASVLDFGTTGYFRGLTASGNRFDIFALSNSTTLTVGGSYPALALKGKNTRPTYNGSEVALLSDVGSGGGAEAMTVAQIRAICT